MIKSRIIMLLVSCALTVSVGVGGYFVSKAQKPQTEVTENNDKVNKVDEENKDINIDKDTSNDVGVENNKENDKSSQSNKENDKSSQNNNEITDSRKVENNESIDKDSATNNQNNNKGNQFADNKIEENIFENSNTNTNNGTSNESEQGGSIIEQDPTTEESSDAYIAQIEQAIFQRVNKERAANGLAPLAYNGTMEYYARYKSKDMGDNGYFDHNDLKGELITAQMKRDGVTYNAWGENIAYIQGSFGNEALATKFMDNWMNSSGHRANILSSNFSSIGVGVYKVGNTYYATQEFYR